MTSATHNNKKYVKGLVGVENQFFDMLKEHMSEDVFLMRLIDEWVHVDGELVEERRFYVELRGKKNDAKKKCLSSCLNTWFLKLENTKCKERGVPLASNSQQQKVKELFVQFKSKGILYTTQDFGGAGELLGVCKEHWGQLKAQDPTFGMKSTKPTYDEDGDESFIICTLVEY